MTQISHDICSDEKYKKPTHINVGFFFYIPNLKTLLNVFASDGFIAFVIENHHRLYLSILIAWEKVVISLSVIISHKAQVFK